MLPIAILAGGLATRLRPLTDRTPKALLPVAGRPFIWHQLRLLRQQGAHRVVLCVAHLADQIEAAVGGGESFGLSVEYSLDGEALLGTGGAVRKALPLLGERFLVLNGDSYLHCPLEDIATCFASSRRPALMTVLRNENRWERSNVLIERGRLIRYDKRSSHPGMCHIDFGLCGFSVEAFSPYAGRQPLDLADICRDLSLAGELDLYEVSERFYEVGSFAGLRDTEAHLA